MHGGRWVDYTYLHARVPVECLDIRIAIYVYVLECGYIAVSLTYNIRDQHHKTWHPNFKMSFTKFQAKILTVIH